MIFDNMYLISTIVGNEHIIYINIHVVNTATPDKRHSEYSLMMVDSTCSDNGWRTQSQFISIIVVDTTI